MKVILASGSKYRQALLQQIGLPFEVLVPQVDETLYKNQKLEASVLAKKLAELKGLTVQKKVPDCLVIASDQVAHLEQKILSKPGTTEQALKDLKLLQGKTHELVTALWMSHPTLGVRSEVVVAKIKMRSLSEQEIIQYIQTDQPLDCAGSYKWEKAGITLLESVDCPDTSSIVGLPLLTLTGILKEWQLPLPFAWPHP